jgi:NitT/TauT family transport system ATP-binding protein
VTPHDSEPAPARAAIRLSRARKIYGSGATAMTALADVDLTIPAGRFVSVIGPSGCGKSTLLRLVADLEAPDAGSVEVLGESPATACDRKHVGFVPQSPALLPWLNVLQNVTLPHRVNRGAGRKRTAANADAATTRPMPDMTRLLTEVGLGEALHKLPHELSGGMQQRVAIVRALGLQPDVLLMDEPFSALDEFTRESLQEQLLDLWDQTTATVLFVTHSVSEAVRLSDTVVVMAPRPGRIVDVIDIDLPRPRSAELLASPDFHHFEDLVRGRLLSAWHSSDLTPAA